jgi:parallel beta-helix repeat protein
MLGPLLERGHPVGVLWQLRDAAEVLIKGCTIRGNRARGILLGSRGKIVVENNLFHVPGAAILFEGDARFWFEQAGVRDVVIRNNVFDNCNYGVWGSACIEVGSGIPEEFRKTSRYNRNIRIENNLFKVFGNQTLLGIYSVDGLMFKGNRLEQTTIYPARPGPQVPMFNVVNSDNIQTEPVAAAGLASR